MKNYEEMSDFEINQAIAIGIHSKMSVGYDYSKHLSVSTSYDGERVIDYCGAELDYCNNPRDAWPIILENKIYLYPYNEKLWRVCIVTSGKVTLTAMNENPLRCAMIVYLMKREAK
jgi:hypothetical protein